MEIQRNSIEKSTPEKVEKSPKPGIRVFCMGVEDVCTNFQLSTPTLIFRDFMVSKSNIEGISNMISNE